MLRNNIRHLLVVDNDNTKKPIGMITPLDLRDEEFTDEGLRDAIEELSEGSTSKMNKFCPLSLDVS